MKKLICKILLLVLVITVIGLDIISESETVTTRYGVKTAIARYILKPENK